MAVLRYAPGTSAHGQRQARVDDECVTYEQALGVRIMPDISDPATLGCLLHLVREAWNACRISVCFSAYTPDATKRWSVPISFFKDQRDLVHVPSFYGEAQAEALVAALEAAP